MKIMGIFVAIFFKVVPISRFIMRKDNNFSNFYKNGIGFHICKIINGLLRLLVVELLNVKCGMFIETLN